METRGDHPDLGAAQEPSEDVRRRATNRPYDREVPRDDDTSTTTRHPDTASPWAVRVETLLLWAVLGAGVGCQLGALAVGAYTTFFASRPVDCVTDGCVASTRLATVLAWAVVAGAATLLVGLLVIRLRPDHARARATKRASALAALTAAAVIAGYTLTHYTRERSRIAVYQPASEQMWTVTAAVWLFAAGALVVAVLGVPLLAWPRQTSVAATTLGVVAALAVSSVVAAQALHRGDDSQYVDATTASEQAVPALPAVLGSRRFERQLPNRGGVSIYPAGAGFIVKANYADGPDVPDVVAYDVFGQERWHYQRTGPVPPRDVYPRSSMAVQDIAVFEDGAVVVLAFFSDKGPYIGLDAVTGAHLWTSNDPAIGAALPRAHTYPPARHFLARVDGQLIALDPRTGRRLWTVGDPMHCPPSGQPRAFLPNFDQRHVYSVETRTRIASVLDCSTPTKTELRLVTVDPGTGVVTGDGPLSTFDDVTPDTLNSWAAYPVPGSDAVFVGLYGKGPSRYVYVDPAAGRRLDFVEPEYFDAAGDGVFTVRDGDRLRTFSGAGDALCTIALGTTSRVTSSTILRDQIVLGGLAPGELAVFDRASCRRVATVTVSARFEHPPIPVRGATVLVSTDDDHRTTVLGFAP